MNTEHDCGITTETMFDAMKDISLSIKHINKTRLILKKWKKAHQNGLISDEKLNAVKIEAERIFAKHFFIVCEAGMYVGQNDKLSYEERAKLHAKDLL